MGRKNSSTAGQTGKLLRVVASRAGKLKREAELAAKGLTTNVRKR